MKYTNLIFIISLLIACSVQEQLSKTFDNNYFVGNWLMTGYGCDRHTPKVEKMIAHMDGDTMIAVKTLGDNCVTTGTETFRGKLPAVLKTGQNMRITYVVGNARKPNSGHWRNSMHIININEFRSQNRVYTRDSKQNLIDNPPKPVPAPAPVVAATPAPVVAPTPAPVVVPTVVPVVVAPTVVPAQHLVYYYHNYFLGNWNGIGYICNHTTPKIEVVNIRYQKGNLYAVKLLGDDCVVKGLTFDGAIPAKIWQGIDIPVNFVIGSPKHPSARQEKNTIHIVDLNTFKIGNHTFYRVMGAGSTAPHGAYINMTPIVGKNYPGPGFVKLNPKKNMRSPVRRFVIVEEETNKPGNC